MTQEFVRHPPLYLGQIYTRISNVKHLLVKHRETLNVESALFNGFFRLEKLSIFETLGKKLTCLTLGIYCMGKH